MLSALRHVSRVSAALCASALPLLNGCGSSPTSTVPASSLDFYNTAVMVANDSSNCAWMTVYWANSDISPWHKMDGGTLSPRFVAAGQRYNFGFLLIPKVPLFGALQIKVLAEVQRGPGCGGGQIADPSSNNKGLKPIGTDADVCAHVTGSGTQFIVTNPELYRDTC
jgi:hypothetical protein